MPTAAKLVAAILLAALGFVAAGRYVQLMPEGAVAGHLGLICAGLGAVVGIHGVGGVTGVLLLGVFASRTVNPGGVDGLLAGGGLVPLLVQAMGVLVVCVYAFAVSWLILKLTDRLLGLRVGEEGELQGLDRSEHAETAYN